MKEHIVCYKSIYGHGGNFIGIKYNGDNWVNKVGREQYLTINNDWVEFGKPGCVFRRAKTRREMIRYLRKVVGNIRIEDTLV